MAKKIFDFSILAVYLHRKPLRAHSYITRNTAYFKSIHNQIN